MEKKKYTEEERQEAIQKVVKLLNDFELTIFVDHQVKIVPNEGVNNAE